MSNDQLDFEAKTEDDKDVDDAIESILAAMRKQMERDEGNVSILAPAQMQKLSDTFRTMKRLTKNISGVKVFCEVNEPFVGIGSVSVIGKNILFNNPESFVQAIKKANNFEVYPKTDGRVQMNFTFHGLTMVVGKNK